MEDSVPRLHGWLDPVTSVYGSLRMCPCSGQEAAVGGGESYHPVSVLACRSYAFVYLCLIGKPSLFIVMKTILC